MVNTKNKILASLLSRIALVSRRSFRQCRDSQALATELIHVADQAITARKTDLLQMVSEALSLLDLPQYPYEAVSEYYEAMIIGAFDTARSDLMLRRID